MKFFGTSASVRFLYPQHSSRRSRAHSILKICRKRLDTEVLPGLWWRCSLKMTSIFVFQSRCFYGPYVHLIKCMETRNEWRLEMYGGLEIMEDSKLWRTRMFFENANVVFSFTSPSLLDSTLCRCGSDVFLEGTYSQRISKSAGHHEYEQTGKCPQYSKVLRTRLLLGNCSFSFCSINQMERKT